MSCTSSMPSSMFRLLAMLGALAVGAGLGSTAQAASVAKEAAAIMAQNCYTCHGPQGQSPGTIPSLHHLTAKNIAELLKAFRSGERPSTVMGRHAKGYSDEQIEALAQYIAERNIK